MNYLIFDFDGVLGDTDASRTQVIKEIEGKTKKQIAIEKDQYFTKSYHTSDAKLSQEEIVNIQNRRNRFGKLLHQKGFDLFHGFIEELKKIKDAKMAVVSSGSFIHIKPKLKNCGLKFSHILTFEDHHSKEEKVKTVCRDWGISPREAYFFTDTISDVKELENIMSKDNIYGCAWGYQGAKKLSTVLNKNHILYNFLDIQKII